MSAGSLIASFAAGSLAACALAAGAEPPAFDESQSRALQEAIDRAVARALDDPTVGDGDARTQPEAAVIWSKDVPSLTEAQRVELGRMVDAAVRRVLAGNAPVAKAAQAAQPSQQGTSQARVEQSLPMTDLRAETLEGRLAVEQGYDVASAHADLETGRGAVQSALELTDSGINSSPTTPGTSSLQVLASTEGARASLKLDQSSSSADALGSGVYWSRSLVFSAPIDKNNNVGTTLVGLDGLTNNFEMAYNASRIRTEPLGRPDRGEPSLLFKMPAACTLLGIPINECDYSTLLRVAHDRSDSPDRELAETADEIAQTYSLPGQAWVQGFRIKAGYDSFTYFDPVNLGKHSPTEIPWSAGVFAGLLKGTSYYSVGLDYLRSYKAATSGTACPIADPGAVIVRCVNGALGPPSLTERHLFNVEGRWLLGQRAIGFKTVHDFKNGNWGVDMPIYIFPNDKGFLSGGLRLGWTDEQKFSAGIFVGTSFKLLD